ncbi:hypothetical protein D4R99_00360 [bacterium]|nr:MAG: hypothetical protein D4R99_00360 [bacterium]
MLDDTEDSKLLDQLEYLKKTPLDLNSVIQKDLEVIPYINSIISKNIIGYRKKNGNFKSKRELLKVEGITQVLYDKIKLYVIAKNSKTDYVKEETGKVMLESKTRDRGLIANTLVNFRSRFQQDLQTKEGFLNGNYPGSKAKIYNRVTGLYKQSAYQFEANATIEKDAGETNPADFYSGYVELKEYKFIKNAVIGDYSLNFGQGLGMFTSLSSSKGAEAIDVLKKSKQGLDSYRSTNEVQFFRGAATKLNFNKFNVYAFASYNNFDASIDTTLDAVSSFYFDGYHRTTSEQNRKGSGKERLFGGRVSYDNGPVRIGATYWSSKFSPAVSPDSIRELYNFNGDNANMLSLDYDFTVKNVNLFGEFARSQSGSVAALGAVQFAFYSIADVVFLYRNYPENFAPVHSFGFGENNGNTNNETGFYTGITLNPIKNLVINAYYDQFKFPYRTYYNPVPTEGNDFMTNVDYRVYKGLTLNLKYRLKNKEESRTIVDEFGRDTKTIDNRKQTNLRTGFTIELSDNLRFRTRFEYVYVGYKNYGGDNKGYLFFSDIRARIVQDLSLSTRLAIFNTDDYDSRIYEYEEDLRGVMSNIAVYGKGTRLYFLLKYEPFDFLEITGKYSQTYYDGVKYIGTGNDYIPGSLTNRFNLGVEILF